MVALLTSYVRESDYHWSVEDIANVVQFLSVEDAILIAKTKILCLNDISLEGDIADNISL
jgi:hypothetical protein